MRSTQVIERSDLDAVFGALSSRGYTIVGPTVREQAIVYDEITSSADYRIKRRDDEAVFGYAVGPHSWKQYQLPPQLQLWRAELDKDGGLKELVETFPDRPRYAFFGTRSCELHAGTILQRVLGDPGPEPPFVVAVQCAQAGGTCFCVSMNTGPVAERGFDLALTELMAPGRHEFVVEVGSERGEELLAAVPHHAALDEDRAAAQLVHERTSAQMGRELDTIGIKELLYRNYEHPRWDEVADRCLTCGNCTMVCPTCFCTTVEDVTDLDGTHVERHQSWDSCFTVDYSHLSGGAVRSSARSRYRQWMTHKLATWIDQFGSSGCVGCGRCITWCPVGIDISEEAQAIRDTERGSDADD